MEDRVDMPRPSLLRFPRSHRERQTAAHVALARVAGGIVEPLPPLRDITRPLRKSIPVDATAVSRAVAVRTESSAVLLVPRQPLRAGRRDSRQHDRHTRSLQRLEQHTPPVPRPHHTADPARPLLAGSALPPSRATLARCCSLSRTAHDLHHQVAAVEHDQTARAANAGRRLSAPDGETSPRPHQDAKTRPLRHQRQNQRRARNAEIQAKPLDS